MIDLRELNGYSVDLGGTKTAAARISGGLIADRKQRPTDGNAAPDEQVVAMGELLDTLGYRRGDSLGVAITGRVDSSGVWHAVNKQTLTRISSVAIRENIVAAIGPAIVANDAAAATIAEASLGSGKGYEHFGYVTVSTGVGGGLYLGGRLHQSADGLAGHVGFSASSHGTHMCGSGRRGTVESIASGNAIARAATAAGHPGLDARRVFDRAAKGDEWAEPIIETSARAVADLCADLTTSLGLQAIALGGSIGLASGYLQRVQAHLGKLPQLFRPILLRSTLGSDGPLLGALLLVNSET